MLVHSPCGFVQDSGVPYPSHRNTLITRQQLKPSICDDRHHEHSIMTPQQKQNGLKSQSKTLQRLAVMKSRKLQCALRTLASAFSTALGSFIPLPFSFSARSSAAFADFCLIDFFPLLWAPYRLRHLLHTTHRFKTCDSVCCVSAIRPITPDLSPQARNSVQKSQCDS